MMMIMLVLGRFRTYDFRNPLLRWLHPVSPFMVPFGPFNRLEMATGFTGFRTSLDLPVQTYKPLCP